MFCTAILSDWSDCSPAADEVHDDGDHGEEEQEVNEEAAHGLIVSSEAEKSASLPVHPSSLFFVLSLFAVVCSR